MAKPKKGLNPTVAFVVSIVLALFALGLPMIGVTVNLWLGVLLLTGAFTLSVYAFLIWEGPYKWRKVLRISTVICAAVLYFPLIGYQVKEQYRKDHSVATSTRIAAEASHQPNAPADPNPQPITPAPKRELPAEPAHLFTGGIHGSDNTILNDPRSIVGNGNTVVGPTDAHGNTILNGGGVALGHRASAGDTSIAIGAGAHAGASAPNQECNTGAQCNYADKGGTISNPTVNNYGVAPLTVTDGQISKMSLFMVTNLKQSGPVKIIYQMDVPGGREMAYKLAQMFTSRGIDANVDAPTMIAGGCNLSVEPGITVDCISDRNTDLAQAIEKALLSAGVSKTPQITPPAPARPEMPLLLIIRKSS